MWDRPPLNVRLVRKRENWINVPILQMCVIYMRYRYPGNHPGYFSFFLLYNKVKIYFICIINILLQIII